MKYYLIKENNSTTIKALNAVEFENIDLDKYEIIDLFEADDNDYFVGEKILRYIQNQYSKEYNGINHYYSQNQHYKNYNDIDHYYSKFVYTINEGKKKVLLSDIINQNKTVKNNFKYSENELEENGFIRYNVLSDKERKQYPFLYIKDKYGDTHSLIKIYYIHANGFIYNHNQIKKISKTKTEYLLNNRQDFLAKEQRRKLNRCLIKTKFKNIVDDFVCYLFEVTNLFSAFDIKFKQYNNFNDNINLLLNVMSAISKIKLTKTEKKRLNELLKPLKLIDIAQCDVSKEVSDKFKKIIGEK